MSILGRIIKNRRVTLFFILALAIFGIYSYWLLPKQENPEIAPPVAVVTVVYPGASPEDIEASVTTKVEDELASLEGYDYIESYSRHSVSTSVVWLTNEAAVKETWDELRRKMDALQAELPEGCRKIDVNTDLDATAGFIFSLTGEDSSLEELAAVAEKIKKELTGLKGVTRIEIQGDPLRQLIVEVDYARLSQLKISLNDLAKTLQAQNLEIPSGDIKNDSFSINVNTPGKLKSVEEAANLVIGVSPENGNVLRLKDVAQVRMEADEDAIRVKHNGKDSVLLTGYFQKGLNVVFIGSALDKHLEKMEAGLAEGMALMKVHYQPDDIKESINGVMVNLLQGIGFVILVIFWGMGLRNAIVVSFAIPLSILITFASMNVLKIQVDQISVVGLIIALGMLVDNAIVVSDAIQVRLDNFEERLSACAGGIKDVAIPVLTSTLTTVTAYIPLLILPGTAGEYIRSVPQIVIISLTASYLVALFVTPTLAFMFFKAGGAGTRGDRLWTLFRNLSIWTLERKKTVIWAAGAIFIGSLCLVYFLNIIFFPKADKSIIYLDILSEQAANIAQTAEVAREVEEILLSQEEVLQTTTSVGKGLPKFFMTMPNPIKSADTGQIMVALDLKKGGRFKNNTQMIGYLQKLFDTNISGATVTAKELEQAEPAAAPLVVRITGEDHDLLQKTAAEIKALLRGIPGAANVDDDAGGKEYQYQVNIDTGQASQMGLTRYDILSELNAALSGQVVSQLRDDSGKEYDIVVKSNIHSLAELENLSIKSAAAGNKVLLRQVAQVELALQMSAIKRYNRERVINILSDVQLGHSAVDIQNKLEKRVAALETADLRITYDGEKNKIIKYFGSLGIAAIFALLLVYIIMLIQFSSLTQPLIILAAIPLSIIGSIIGLLVFQQPLSFTALLGAVSLFGVVINNAILLLDYINGERRRGQDLDYACHHAVGKRIRPILLTTVTTVLGLIPLIFSGTLFVPMAISLMCGLLVSTLLTLLVIPVIYALAEGKRRSQAGKSINF
ncbi:MAG: efflux RND transporter permease subunit [Clostridia bacterium]|jgi:multidrug efflux pump subunit AcrB|nr:efflux RND transporter permease subunit [Clostridia bacterium]